MRPAFPSGRAGFLVLDDMLLLPQLLHVMRTYKVIEVAKRYGVSCPSIYQWMRDGKLLFGEEKRGMVTRKIITDAHLIEMENRLGVRPVNR